jgi:medium-chain acyl-[acyl-carrier-protein] hydrolase
MMDRWLIRYAPPAVPRLRLFCLPYAGAGASLFASWPDLLPDGVELNAVQLPGRENRLREEPFTHLQPLLPGVGRGDTAVSRSSLCLLGYSFGALLAFELARYLRRDGSPLPQHLFVLGRRAPHLESNAPPVHRYSDAELVAWMRDLGGTPTLILEHPELLPIFLPILRADLTLHETYDYRRKRRWICPSRPLAVCGTARPAAKNWKRGGSIQTAVSGCISTPAVTFLSKAIRRCCCGISRQRREPSCHWATECSCYTSKT